MDDKTFDLLTKMYGEFSSRFDSIDSRFEEVEKRLDSIEGRIVILEDKQNTDSKALFDGYKLLYEKAVKIESDVEDIKDILKTHEVKI